MLTSTTAQTAQFPARRFQRDERGSVAVIFGLVLTVVTLFVGAAIDTGRAVHSNARLGEAMDAAVLAAAKGLRLEGLSAAEAKALGELVFATNMANTSGRWTDIQSAVVTIDPVNFAATIDVRASVKTAFFGIAGIRRIDLPKSANAVFSTNPIEVSLQLDTTGSMCEDWPRCTKIKNLRDATVELVDILIPDNAIGQKVRVGIAPFAAGVNAGSYLPAVDGMRSSSTSCVYEREVATYQTTDAPAIGMASMKILSDTTPAPAWQSKACPSTPVLALTDDKTALKATANSLTANGSTAGHLGTAWAWYLLSPNWNALWNLAIPVSNYDDGATRKIAVLMTDGQYNAFDGIQNDANTPIASAIAVDTCSEMKARGITVYTVGFRLDPAIPLSISTLRDCASGPDKALRAENGAELSAAFHTIGNQIMKLHITR